MIINPSRKCDKRVRFKGGHKALICVVQYSLVSAARELMNLLTLEQLLVSISSIMSAAATSDRDMKKKQATVIMTGTL